MRGRGQVRRAEIIALLSLAADLAMGQPMGFGLRSCVLGMSLAEALGYGAEAKAEVYYHALLRYAGCTAQTDTLTALFGDEIALRQDFALIDPARSLELLPMVFRHVWQKSSERAPHEFLGSLLQGLMNSRRASAAVFEGHCEAAGRLAFRLGLRPEVIRNLGQLYERWDGKGLPGGLAGEAIAPAVRVVVFAQDAIVLNAALTPDGAADVLRQRRGAAYEPAVVDAYVGQRDALLAGADEAEPWERVLALEPEPARALSEAELDDAVPVISDFIDLKSPVIAGHSRAVAALAAGAAEAAGLPASDVTDLRRAGLLHDLGYAAIPAQFRLGEGGGAEHVRLHPYYGERLLSRSPALAHLGVLVAEHHERLDGSGFHRGRKAAELSLASRLLAVAEAYQGLIENRPFRVTLTPAQAANAVRQDARNGLFDGAAVDAVLRAAGLHFRGKKPSLVAGMTAREVEVLRLVALGHPIKDIATGLGIAPKTVDNHIQGVYAKIGVKTRAGATLFAIEHGLLPYRANVGDSPQAPGRVAH